MKNNIEDFVEDFSDKFSDLFVESFILRYLGYFGQKNLIKYIKIAKNTTNKMITKKIEVKAKLHK